MKKLTKSQIIALVFLFILLDYALTIIFCLYFNGLLKKIYLVKIGFVFSAIINNYPYIYKSLGFATLISSLICLIIPLIPRQQSLHGDARFATKREIKKMGLFSKKGIIVGKYQGKLLKFGGQQFVALGAPTRSGKGVGIVIPNLLEWEESAVVQDIKQECFDFTSKYRKEKLGNEVYLFNPFDRRTHRYNPLAYINMSGTNADGELTDFANILYPLAGDSTTQFFNQLAQNLFIGLCYLTHDLLSSEMGLAFIKNYKLDVSFTLYGILSISEGFNFTVESSEDEEESIKQEIKGFENTYNWLCELKIASSKAQERIKSYFAIDSDNTRSGVMSSFNAPLMAFRADNMRLATSANDFDFRDLRKKKITIYIGITPDQLANAKLILNIFWQQLILVNTKELPQANPKLKYTVMLMMDEFTASGYLPTYLKGISFIAGYGLRSVMIYQSNSQLEMAIPDGYGKEGAKTLLTNHACQIYYAPREQEDAEKISKILGNMTVANKSTNYQNALSLNVGGSESKTVRALMLPQELREMQFEKELVTIDAGKPILCDKAFYYSDNYFMDKFKSISKSLAKIKDLPTKKELETAIQNKETRIDIPYQNFEIMKQENEKILEENLLKLTKEVA